jgi:predicted aminopeptidase
LQDETTPPRIKDLLAEVEPIKKFGESQGLKPTPNYREYVHLDRTAAVYVVSASAPLEFKAKTWGFPIVGSFPYLGWFDYDDARNFADGLRKEGLDVDVRGARAYSTLGWFRDAVLSTMIPPGPEALGDLVNTVIHESTHATLYIKGQSYFDESLAEFVAEKLTPVYFKVTARGDSPELNAYIDGEAEDRKITRGFHEAYEALEKVYASSKSDAEKLEEKAKILADTKTRLGFKRDINNATLIQYKTYNTGRLDFERLWASCSGDLRRFLGALQSLRSDSFQESQQEDLGPVLGPLIQKGC